MSRIEIQQLTENRAGFFETADSMIKLINQVTPKNAKKTRQQLDQLKNNIHNTVLKALKS